MHTFYVADGMISQDEARHACRVLRLQTGDEIDALDGNGRRFLARITELSDNSGRVEFVRELPSNESPAEITVYQGIPKAEKMELLAQKLTELGVCRFVPVRMERCVVKLDDKEAARRAQRLDRISHEAVKQCGRARPMEISPAMDFGTMLREFSRQDLILVPWEEASGTRMKDLFNEHSDARKIAIVIGPEGGISEKEIDRMCAAGAAALTLGPRILRTETAAMTSASLAMALWGDI